MPKYKIKAIITLEDRSIRIVKLKSNTLTFKWGDFAWDIDDKDYYSLGKTRTYFFNYNNTAPVNIDTGKVTKYNASMYNKGLKSRTLDKLLDVANGGMMSIENLIMLFVIIAVVAVGVINYLQISNLQDQIAVLQDQLSKVLGV